MLVLRQVCCVPWRCGRSLDSGTWLRSTPLECCFNRMQINHSCGRPPTPRTARPRWSMRAQGLHSDRTHAAAACRNAAARGVNDTVMQTHLSHKCDRGGLSDRAVPRPVRQGGSGAGRSTYTSSTEVLRSCAAKGAQGARRHAVRMLNTACCGKACAAHSMPPNSESACMGSESACMGKCGAPWAVGEGHESTPALGDGAQGVRNG